MTQENPSADYHIYLLTIWREEDEVSGAFQGLRFRLEDPRTGERRGYSSADALFAFLQASLFGQDGGR
jgi:hypothetical protein